MNFTAPPNFGRINGIPAHELLEGLGQLHQRVLVTDTQGRVQWTSLTLARRLGLADGGAGLHVSDLCQRLLALDASKMDPDPSQDDVAPRVRRQLDGMLDHLANHESLIAHRLDLVQADGTPLLLEVNAFGVDSQSEHESVRLYVAIIRSISKQEDTLAFRDDRADETHLAHAVLQQSQLGVLVIDRFHFISYASTAASRLLGKNRGALIDKPVALFLPNATQLLAAQQATGEESDRAEEQVLRIGDPEAGNTRWLSFCARTLSIPDRGIEGHAIEIRDVSESRREREKLLHENAALESYVHSISHDLRSPLVSMLGFTRLLRQDYEDVLDEPGRHFLDRVEQAGRTMNMLLRDLLELSRIDCSRVHRSPIDPRSLLLQVHAELKPRLEERDVQLSLPAAPPMIHCDQTQLYQVFSNLVGNALQHMGTPADGRPPCIDVEIQQTSGGGLIIVRDNGVGIAHESQDAIFDAFHTVGRSNGSQSTGIGLAIVRKIAIAHEGRAWVESEPGRGAAFHVRFPIP